MSSITLADCIALCGLEEDELAAIAEHEHMPEVVAAAFGNYMLHQAGGTAHIRNILKDDFRDAIRANNHSHAREVLTALRHFIATHRAELSHDQVPKST